MGIFLLREPDRLPKDPNQGSELITARLEDGGIATLVPLAGRLKKLYRGLEGQLGVGQVVLLKLRRFEALNISLDIIVWNLQTSKAVSCSSKNVENRFPVWGSSTVSVFSVLSPVLCLSLSALSCSAFSACSTISGI